MRQLKAWVRVSYRTRDLHPGKKRWEVIYTDPEHPTRPFGQRTKGGFRSKQSAQEWADDFLNRARSGSYTDPLKAEATFAEP